MEPKKGNIIFELKSLDNLIKRKGDAHMRALDKDHQITRMHHWIIGYLYRQRAHDVYQRDIEAEFRISRSTTSNMLSLMEKKGFISRQSVDSDARLKRVVLTDKAIELHTRHMDDLHHFDTIVENSITPQEKSEFLRIIEKLRCAIKAQLESEHIRTDN